jgi:methyltransferase (TIGR00027 family)
MCRAASCLEKDPFFSSGDYIAVKLLPRFIRFLLLTGILNLKGTISPKGIYPYVVARTKYIDSLFRQAVRDGFEQVLILGAGFDSRAIRLSDQNGSPNVYEIDTVHTQQAKIKQYKKRKIRKPAHNVYIPVDFDKEDLKAKLVQHDVVKDKKSLFILEGLIMYLSERSVEETFKLLDEYCAPGSFVVFDYVYASVLRKELRYFGEQAIRSRVTKDKEQWTFGIEEGGIEQFLESFNFSLIEHLDSKTLEHRYFTDEHGHLITRINGTHCIVLAGKDPA